MALRLVKTVSGENGAPETCAKCGCRHFNVSSGGAFSCEDCGFYVPRELGSIDALKERLEALTNLHDRFKRTVNELERIVTE